MTVRFKKKDGRTPVAGRLHKLSAWTESNHIETAARSQPARYCAVTVKQRRPLFHMDSSCLLNACMLIRNQRVRHIHKKHCRSPEKYS